MQYLDYRPISAYFFESNFQDHFNFDSFFFNSDISHIIDVKINNYVVLNLQKAQIPFKFSEKKERIALEPILSYLISIKKGDL